MCNEMTATLLLSLAFITVLKYAFELIKAHQLLAKIDREYPIRRSTGGEIKIKYLQEMLLSGIYKSEELPNAIRLLKKSNYDLCAITVLLIMVLFFDPSTPLGEMLSQLHL